MNRPYRGRFAPTPSGPLHFGSLVTALAGWLDARYHGGQWLLRIDDLEPPRQQPGAVDTILRQLDAFQLHWDGDPVYQSRRGDHYQRAVDTLVTEGKAFYCTLSRKQLKALDHIHPGPAVAQPPGPDRAVRLDGSTSVGQAHCRDEACPSIVRENRPYPAVQEPDQF